MKELNNILEGVKVLEIKQGPASSFANIEFDSRKVSDSTLFVAIKGYASDGHDFISNAVENGARIVVCETITEENPDVTWVVVEDSKRALSLMASNFYGNPSSKLKLFGVTGTNGKTTVATQLYRLFLILGKKAGLFSTIKIMAGEEEIVSTHTTPDPITLNRYLMQMTEAGVTHCFMEVSSHGIDQKRIDGLTFAGAAFTNITHDHLDYHKTFKEYIRVKKLFFDNLPSEAFALTNIDDKNGAVMLQNTKAKKLTYSLKSASDYKVKLLESHFSGMLLRINEKELWTKLIGRFNAYNLLAIYASAVELGENEDDVLMAISQLESVDGRFDHFISEKGIITIVDYAHTPDALQNVLNTIADIRSGNEKLISIVGCGGDRDKAKRPLMAKISVDMSDKAILTSDNPRTEKPEAIIEDMEKGLDEGDFAKCISIVDREQAIKMACMEAQKGDIILIAGKGHETYQEINGVKYDFDDYKKAQTILERLKK